jgi:hypothetical protein
MQSGKAFVGFQEAPIDFPPTFKYDVLRTIKEKRRGSKLERWKTPGERARRLTEVDEHGAEDIEGEDSDKEGDGGEAASMSSSVWTSMHSRHGTDAEDDYFHPSPSSQAVSVLSTPGSRVSVSAAAHKAKTKWLALISPVTPGSPTKWLRPKSLLAPPTPREIAKVEEKIGARAVSLDTADQTIIPPSLNRLSSSKSSLPSDEEEDEDDKGVYDSSHKKRVPSW